MARNALGAATFPAGVAVGVGVGGAVGAALEPKLQALKNKAWETFPTLPPDAYYLAQGVAQGQVGAAEARAWAKEQGYDTEQWNALVAIADIGPGMEAAFTLWRRNLITTAGFRRALKRLGLEQEWIDALVETRDVLLSPATAANAWQQGYMTEARAEQEAALSGVTPERSQIQRDLAGLPPGPETGLQMLRRGITDPAGFTQMIVEGNTKRKYADEYLELRNQILSATTAASLWLKGWMTEAQAKAVGAQNGYDGAAMDRLYEDRGRPATVRQAHIGFARGGRLPSAGNNEQETIRRSVEESNIRSEWFDILYSQRFTYPSAFVLRALTQDGTFTGPQTEQILIESGWKPEWATAAADKWSGGGAGPSTKWADRARSRLFTAAHDDYLDGNADEADARAMLGRVGAGGAEIDTIIGLWDVERGRTRRDLTQAQILKLYKKAIWPREQAQAALVDQGTDPGDAADLLDAV